MQVNDRHNESLFSTLRLTVKSREVVDALDEQIRAFCAPLLQSLNG